MINSIGSVSFDQRTCYPRLLSATQLKVAQVALCVFSSLLLAAWVVYRISSHTRQPPPENRLPLAPSHHSRTCLNLQDKNVLKFLENWWLASKPVFPETFCVTQPKDTEYSLGQRDYLSRLPDEILHEIFNYSSARDVGSLARANHRLRYTIYAIHPEPWNQLAQENFYKKHLIHVDEIQYRGIPSKNRLELYCALCDKFPTLDTDPSKGNGFIHYLIRRLGPFTFLCIRVVNDSHDPVYPIERGNYQDGRHFIRFSVKDDKGNIFVQTIEEQITPSKKTSPCWVTSGERGLWPSGQTLTETNCYQIACFFRGEAWRGPLGLGLPKDLASEREWLQLSSTV